MDAEMDELGSEVAVTMKEQVQFLKEMEVERSVLEESKHAPCIEQGKRKEMISQQYQSWELPDSNPGEKTGREAVRKGGGD